MEKMGLGNDSDNYSDDFYSDEEGQPEDPYGVDQDRDDDDFEF